MPPRRGVEAIVRNREKFGCWALWLCCWALGCDGDNHPPSDQGMSTLPGMDGGGGSSGGGSGSGGAGPDDDGGTVDASRADGASGSADAAGLDGGGLPPIAWVDPGTAPWVPVPKAEVESVCKLDLAALEAAELSLNIPWVIVRYGRLCYEHYPLGETAMTAAEVYSTTKTMGGVVTGVAAYQTRDLPRTGPKTGPLSDWDRVDYWLDTFSYNQDAYVAHVLAMVGHNANLAYGQKQHSYDTTGSVQINTLSDIITAAIAQDAPRLGANLEEFWQKFLVEPLGMEVSTWSAGTPAKTFGFTWTSSVRDMARVGLLIVNRGMWNGQRVLGEDWIYKMTHPAFEDGNTGYGYLTWLSAWSNHSIGFSAPVNQGANVTCAPVALWGSYPHGELSMAPDCNYEAPYACTQGLDVGVSQAVGLGGQLIQMHPGLDLVIAARNDPLQGAGVWQALMPAVVNADPMYMGDQTAFCEAYSGNAYAPDLKAPWREVPP